MSAPSSKGGKWQEWLGLGPPVSSAWYIILSIVPIGLIGILAGLLSGTMPVGIRYEQQNKWMLQARSLEEALGQYAQVHEGKFPEGNNSTEIFQKLLDAHGVTDPTVFYVSMPGKKPAEESVLTPQNVCWDVTEGVMADSPDELPVVFMTGYRVTYAADASAVPVILPFPHFGTNFQRTWVDRFPGYDVLSNEGIAVGYKNGDGAFLPLNRMKAGGLEVLHFVPKGFDARGRVYRQVGPEGVVP